MRKAEVRAFYFNLENNLFSLHEQLAAKIYRPDKYAFFFVRDPKLRPIHKAVVRDRVVFQAVFRVLYHIFDRKFVFDAYSCRFKKGTHAGVRRLKKFIEKASQNYHRQVFILKCDIRQFFYSIDHQVLFNLIKREIDDANLLDLTQKIIDSFRAIVGKGIPLGNVTSQLCANIYLNKLDQFVKHILKEKYYLRYCDDFIIVSRDKEHLAGLVPQIESFLAKNLKLFLHPNKIQIRKLSQGADFLGFVVLPHHTVLRTKTKRRIFIKICKEYKLVQAGEISLQCFNQMLQSYFGLLGHGDSYAVGRELLRRCGR